MSAHAGTRDADDGTEDVDDSATDEFLKWLSDNGAKHPKVQWPSRSTVQGVRGATALADIESDEHMIEVPAALLMSPVTCMNSEEIGHVYRDNPALFRRDDTAIALLLMHERHRGAASFFAPFLRMLCHPCTASDWSDEELAQLHDPSLGREARARDARLRQLHASLFRHLSQLYPEHFAPDDCADGIGIEAPRLPSGHAAAAPFGFARFRWAWNTVQARAFGRRLPWTALVPFADTLNHSSVRVKYDWNVDGNGAFRLFPTGGNRYAAGSEVFNSYGRRDNRHLLLDYGFAMEDNEWDYALLEMGLPLPQAQAGEGAGGAQEEVVALLKRRANLLLRCGFSPGVSFGAPGSMYEAHLTGAAAGLGAGGAAAAATAVSKQQLVRVRGDTVCAEALIFARIASLGGRVEAAEASEEGEAREGATTAASELDAFEQHVMDSADKAVSESSSSQPVWRRAASVSVRRLASCRVGKGFGNERQALATVAAALRARLDGAPTTLEEDLSMLAAARAGGGGGSCAPRLVAALRYRIGQKRVITCQLALLRLVEAQVTAAEAHLQAHCGGEGGTVHGGAAHTVLASLARYSASVLEPAAASRAAVTSTTGRSRPLLGISALKIQPSKPTGGGALGDGPSTVARQSPPQPPPSASSES